MSSKVNRELLRRIANGNKDDFSIVLDEYQELVYCMIYRQIGDEGISEDLTQQTFIKAYRSLNKFRGESQFRTWLIRIALNEVNSYVTSTAYQQRQKASPIENIKESTNSADEQNENFKSLRDAFRKLRPTFQEVLTLCSIEGYSYDEAAQSLSIPVSTVRSRLNAARIALKALLFSKDQP